MATTAELSENSHQGFEGIKAALCLASMEAKSNTASGMRACLRRNGIGSRSSGKERDETGLDYFLARYYSGTQGRFITPDWSKKQEPVPYARLNNPQTLNLYGYVLNNPISRVDPDGHIDCSGKNAEGAGCQAIAKWNVEHGIGAVSVSEGRTTWIVHSDGTLEKRSGNIAFRDNNPGDIRPNGPFDVWKQGAIGVDNPILKGGKKDPSGFAVWENSADGEAALRALINTPAVQGRTILDEMKKFAPSNDNNDPKAYAADLARALGVDVTSPMNKLTPEQVNKFIETIKQKEGFYDPNGKSEIIK